MCSPNRHCTYAHAHTPRQYKYEKKNGVTLRSTQVDYFEVLTIVERGITSSLSWGLLRKDPPSAKCVLPDLTETLIGVAPPLCTHAPPTMVTCLTGDNRNREVKLPLISDLLDLVDMESACLAQEATRATRISKARSMPGYSRPLLMSPTPSPSSSAASCSPPPRGAELQMLPPRVRE